MPLEVFVSRRAAREIERIVAWWQVNRPAAPGVARQDIEAVFALLAAQPGIGTRVRQASSPEVRRIHVDRIRYWIYYRTRGNRLEILSVWHSGRGSGPAV
jgi:plasmid stabilization system protein ParE